MPFTVPIKDAQANFPEYKFIKALTPSEQKAAFHVQNSDGEDLCLKIIAPNYSVDRLQREIIALQTLNHPNVVKLQEYTYSSTPTQQRHYMIEDFIEGDDLSDRLLAGVPWSRIEVADFFIPLTEGLNALSEAKIVHRDLKPNNIRVRQNGSPVIIDFGLARHLDKSDITLTAQGAAIGTPVYFAPEQFTGTKREIDHRTDIFAIGIIMYQALTGNHPFAQPSQTYQQLSDAICSSDAHLNTPEFLGLPNQWRLLLTRLLEKERGKRIQNAKQVSTILQKIGGV